jgi:hypothetical protein
MGALMRVIVRTFAAFVGAGAKCVFAAAALTAMTLLLGALVVRELAVRAIQGTLWAAVAAATAGGLPTLPARRRARD